MPDPSAPWWRDAVIYQVYPRSFADANGDGVGDLPGIAARLEHVAALGADAVWISPFFRSPQRDGGYDVADFCDVDPVFGTLADADALVARAHALGLRIIIDMVPNHTSIEHAWFKAALAAPPGSRERARYHFRDGSGAHGELPPSNWESIFGGPAWTRVTEADGTPGQWYLHLFDSSQPDLNWANPEVAEEFDRVLRFWLDRGVDGFRVDVANGLAKDASFADLPAELLGRGGDTPAAGHPYWNRDEVHDVWRRWRRLIDAYPGERALVAEAWVMPLKEMAKWVRADEFHQTFNFGFLLAGWDATRLRAVIDESLAAFGGVGAPATWVLSNHDSVRHPSRLAVAGPLTHGIGIGRASAHKPDPVAEQTRGRAASLLMLALPGGAYLYQGEELGLPEAIDLDDDARQDPTWFRTGPEVYGRDGCRVPLPWQADAPAYGFSPTGRSWLPQPQEWRGYAADTQTGDPASTLELYRQAIRLRKEQGLGSAPLHWNDSPASVLDATIGTVRVVVNLSETARRLPAGEVLLASAQLGGESGDLLPVDATAWVVVGR